MATWTDVLGVFGLSTNIAEAVALAELNPTSSAVSGVVKAYAANGQIIPAQLLAHLVQINEERHPEDTYRGAVAPGIILGVGLILYFLFLRKK